MATALLETLEEFTLSVTQEIRVQASLSITFASLLEELGPANCHPDGTPMPLMLEPWPGGRWFRDLGEGNGHFWGTVQAIKRDSLLEISGPLFMSEPVFNNVQYRLREDGDETVILFRHAAFGLVPADVRMRMNTGWNHIHERVRARASADHTL